MQCPLIWLRVVPLGVWGQMLHQARETLRYLHATQKSVLCATLDREDWRPCEVNAVFQCIADILAGIRSPDALPAAIQAARARTGTPRRELIVCGQPFSACFAVLKLLEVLEKYCSSASRMPAVSATVVELCISLLRVSARWLVFVVSHGCVVVVSCLAPSIQEFNARTDKLLLQAHACKLNTLRTIAAKHLGMAVARAWMLGHAGKHVGLSLTPPNVAAIFVCLLVCRSHSHGFAVPGPCGAAAPCASFEAHARAATRPTCVVERFFFC